MAKEENQESQIKQPVDEKKVIVRLHKDDKNPEHAEPVKVARNSVWHEIPRGESVEVPEGIAKILERSNIN